MATYHLDPDIARAHTLPGVFYHDQKVFDQSRHLVFAKSWQVIEIENDLDGEHNVHPFMLLPGYLDEPLLLITNEEGEKRCLSNVCTHRGNLLVSNPVKRRNLTCGYHGRCFDLEGTMLSMPCFENVKNFPSESDHLAIYELALLGQLTFVSLQNSNDSDKVLGPLLQRMKWFPFDKLELEQSLCEDYFLDAHWALYCENYLEGFHIPFVHEKLNSKLDFAGYQMSLYEMSSVQVGIANQGEECFDLPEDHPDYGKRIYAYYWWLFPNIMVNVYTWGLSLNIVKPISLQRTMVTFRTYLLPGADKERVSSTALHETEMEDEAIVLNVQRGVSSLSYKQGRFSPTMELGVHHFQRLMVQHLNQEI